MPRDVITSRDNPLIRRLSRLAKRRERAATGQYLIEGSREVRRALEAGAPVEMLLVVPDLSREDPRSFADHAADSVEIVELGESAFRSLSRRRHPDGVLAVARSVSGALAQLHVGENPLLLVAEGVEKPGNLGAMLRTADAVGADAVIAADPATDLENPNVIRASQGSVFTVATAVASTAEAMSYLDDAGIRIVALAPSSEHDIWSVDLTGPTAVAVGGEDTGLSGTLLRGGVAARIPMHGAADSLNVSVAAAVALYEARRQRR